MADNAPVSTRARALRAAKLFDGLTAETKPKCALVVAGLLLEEVNKTNTEIETLLRDQTLDCALSVIATFLPPEKTTPIPQAILTTCDDVAQTYGAKLVAPGTAAQTPAGGPAAAQAPQVVQTIGELDRAARWVTLPGNIKIPRHVQSELSCLYPAHWIDMKSKSEVTMVVECWRARAAEFFGSSTPTYLEPKKKRILEALALWISTAPPTPTAENYRQFFCTAELLIELKLLVLFRPAAAASFWEKVDTFWNGTREIDYFTAISSATADFRRQL